VRHSLAVTSNRFSTWEKRFSGPICRYAPLLASRGSVVEILSERERQGLEHLRQAKELVVSLAEYCRSFDLDLNLWYRIKQKLVQKGLAEKGEGRKMAKPAQRPISPVETPPAFARVQIVAPPTPAAEPPPAVSWAPTVCRIVHPSGWVVECGTFPPASWLAAVLAGQRRP
jgi:hypothetical protein